MVSSDQVLCQVLDGRFADTDEMNWCASAAGLSFDKLGWCCASHGSERKAERKELFE